MGILADHSPIVFIMTTDRERSKAFYIDKLGLTYVDEDPFATTFDLNGVPLRLSDTGGAPFTPSPHTIMGWQVDDIEAKVNELTQKGVEFQMYDGFGQDDMGIWSAPDGRAKIAWFLDPEGNNLSLTQSNAY
jgi:catechol 2,3-dioxygenase-like lactoylglutathione lyase family enzyme